MVSHLLSAKAGRAKVWSLLPGRRLAQQGWVRPFRNDWSSLMIVLRKFFTVLIRLRYWWSSCTVSQIERETVASDANTGTRRASSAALNDGNRTRPSPAAAALCWAIMLEL